MASAAESHGPSTLQPMPWRSIFPWLCLARVFRSAVDVRKLILAAAGICFTGLGWWLLDGLSRPSDQAGPGVVYFTHTVFPEQLRHLADRELTFGRFAHLALGLIWTAAVWGLFAGMITRFAAVELAADERVSFGKALRHACRKWLGYFGAPLFPLLGVLATALPLALLGLLLRADVLLLVISIPLWPLALCAGAFMTLLLLGLVFGWPLMSPTISVESTDGFDALSRSYSYVFQRPLHYAFYVAVAFALGYLGWLVVSGFAVATAHLAAWGVSWGCGVERSRLLPELTLGLPGAVEWILSPLVSFASLTSSPAATEELSGSAAAGVAVIRFWNGLVHLLALGYVASYFWTASTAIYLLLRKDTDATEMDDVALDAIDEPYGLPAIVPDDLGAPVVVPSGMPPESSAWVAAGTGGAAPAGAAVVQDGQPAADSATAAPVDG